MKYKFLLALSGLAMIASTPASAANLAILGTNAIGGLYGTGNTVTYVTDSDLATAGFLSAFDAFVYTRDGFSFGQSLSAAAAANVASFVTGNVVLFSGDFADDIGTSNTDLLFNNALSFVLGGTGKGYIGEFNGALSAYGSNLSGYTPIGLIQGAAGTLGFNLGGSSGDIVLTAAGATSPVTAGVAFPYNPGQVEYGFDQAGYNPAAVLAQYDNGTPAIIAAGVGVIGAVPEPASWAMMILGFGVAGGSLRRRRPVTMRVAYAA